MHGYRTNSGRLPIVDLPCKGVLFVMRVSITNDLAIENELSFHDGVVDLDWPGDIVGAAKSSAGMRGFFRLLTHRAIPVYRPLAPR